MINIKYSLRTKLSLSYLLITLFLVSLVFMLSNFILDKQFKNYVISKQEEKNASIAQLLTERYTDWGKRWSINGVESLGINLLEEGLILKVHDAVGNTIWDATVHNNGVCSAMLTHMAENMEKYNPDFQGGYEEQDYPLYSGNTLIGTARIGYYGPYFYSDNEIDFINTLNKILWGAAILALAGALGLGIWMARQLTLPIRKVVWASQEISKGNFASRVDVKSNTKEIGELTSSINSLAESLGGQENLRKRLTADVAHELRTPIATLQSHLEAMIDGIWQPNAERLKSCHEETLRIGKMVGDLEKLARYERDSLILHLDAFNLTDLLKHLLANFEYEFKLKKISPQLIGEEQMIYADKDSISQIFTNLLSNALKYTSEGDEVILKVSGAADQIYVECIDTGVGISPEDLPHIFERFYRADKSRTRITGGSGIGLTITKSLVEAHKGTIDVVSVLGKGSTFVVSLPRGL